jgi:hypothetical protein
VHITVWRGVGPEFFVPLHEQLSRYRPGYPTSALYVDFRLDSVMRAGSSLTGFYATSGCRIVGMLPLLFNTAQLAAFGVLILLLISASSLLLAWVVLAFEPLPIEVVGLVAIGAVSIDFACMVFTVCFGGLLQPFCNPCARDSGR